MKNHLCIYLALLALTASKVFAQSIYTPYTFTNFAGLPGGVGTADGVGSEARFGHPAGVAVDAVGNVYVADSGNNTIRKITPVGEVTTLAGSAEESGSGDGTGRDARFNRPFGVAVDSAGNVFVAETYNNTIRKVTPAGVVTTLAGLAQFDSDGNGVGGSADGTGCNARFNGPSGVAVDSTGNVYVADTENNTIRKGFPAPTILSSGSGIGFNSGQFGFNLTGPIGRSVVVEASTDLVSWLPLWTNTFAPGLKFSDLQSGVYSNRYYRATLPSP